jgi:hypothetical protein
MTAPQAAQEGRTSTRKSLLVRLPPEIYAAINRWAADDLRSVNAQIEMILRDGLRQAGRLPKDLPAPRRRGRPPKHIGDSPENPSGS